MSETRIYFLIPGQENRGFSLFCSSLVVVLQWRFIGLKSHFKVRVLTIQKPLQRFQWPLQVMSKYPFKLQSSHLKFIRMAYKVQLHHYKKLQQNIFIHKLLHAKLQILEKGFEHVMYKAINLLLLC
ncbi:unnamed protein product [Vicia faba]|uniref:Uncharacterized protein n=1 Tax=Vicia faba TaxID=3906 RepID=A0AAV1A122_VICFA|nr:unnamed protein product [Vicia faba]